MLGSFFKKGNNNYHHNTSAHSRFQPKSPILSNVFNAWKMSLTGQFFSSKMSLFTKIIPFNFVKPFTTIYHDEDKLSYSTLEKSLRENAIRKKVSILLTREVPLAMHRNINGKPTTTITKFIVTDDKFAEKAQFENSKDLNGMWHNICHHIISAVNILIKIKTTGDLDLLSKDEEKILIIFYKKGTETLKDLKKLKKEPLSNFYNRKGIEALEVFIKGFKEFYFEYAPGEYTTGGQKNQLRNFEISCANDKQEESDDIQLDRPQGGARSRYS